MAIRPWSVLLYQRTLGCATIVASDHVSLSMNVVLSFGLRYPVAADTDGFDDLVEPDPGLIPLLGAPIGLRDRISEPRFCACPCASQKSQLSKRDDWHVHVPAYLARREAVGFCADRRLFLRRAEIDLPRF